MKVVISLLAVACAVIATELATMTHLASGQNAVAGRLRVFGADSEELTALPIWPDDVEPILGRKIPKLEIPPMTMEKALLEFQKQAGVNLVTPYHGIPAEARDATVEAHLTDVTVSRALQSLLGQAERRLHYNVRDGVIEIGDPFVIACSEDLPVVRIYDVRSLLPPRAVAAQVFEGGRTICGNGDGKPDNLVELIIRNVAPDSWMGQGGPGRIRVWGENVLVIRQTPEIHREITRFLWRLKKGLEEQGERPAGTIRPK